MSAPDALPPPLGALFAAILAARTAQRRQSAQKVNDPSAQAATRRESLRALEAYADALEQRCWPVPRQIQQDIRLHRALCRLPRP
ncbi:hypothetical protein E1212_10465 [Jiangella ureilytica]|uniref:Uncharacterized protein n=1 Tax=Jiangella ureilytica TaxID=2530374 RepID=A0A4R4RQF1_9ACTN|nr:hypothetical protein [Jiangella ureilytica]TDC52020.1 hypothetical protein E1212_10465 [Jiangella ureilytica]